MPLGQQARAVREARALSREVITLVPGDNATSDEWAAVLAVQLRGTPHRLVDGRHAALLPVRDTALIVAPGAEMGLSTYTLLGAVEDLREIPGRAGEAPLLVARLRAGMDLGLEPVPAPSVLANGVELLGYRVEGNPSPGETFTWRVAWRVSAPWYSASRTYHIYNHLLAADGTRVAQADSGTLPTSAWQVGDVVMQAFALAVPASAGPGPYAVRVGMYTFPELENQPLLDAAGAPAGDGVTFGPLAPS